MTDTPGTVTGVPASPSSDLSESAHYRSLARNSAIAGGANVANGLLSAAILALCASFGQKGEIAAYTVVTSTLAFVLIAVGGGSALLYLNGTEEQRVLVRSQWLLVVLPGLFLGAVAVAAFYHAERGYGLGALTAAAVVVLGNGLAQLQIADFSRQMRFLASALLMCASKASSLLMVLLGVPLTVSLATAGLAQLVAGELILGRHGSLRGGNFRRPSFRHAAEAYRAGRHLVGFSVGDLYVARTGTVVLSLVATPAVMDSFGAVVTAYQAIGGVLQSALQVPMVARARSRLGIERSTQSPRFSIAIALTCAIPMAATVAWLAPWLTGTLLSLSHPQSAAWLAVFMLALPFMAVNRALMFNWIGDGHYRWATTAVAVLAAVLTVAVAIGVPRFGPLGTAAASAAAEAATMALILLFASRAAGLRRPTRTPTPTAGSTPF